MNIRGGTLHLPGFVDNLRSHVLHGAAKRVVELLIGALLDAAEVGELDVAPPVQHHVLRLEVPVDDALGVEVLQGEQDLRQVEDGGVLHQHPLLLQLHEELSARQILHDQVDFVSSLEKQRIRILLKFLFYPTSPGKRILDPR